MISGIKKRFSIFNREKDQRNVILTGVPRSGSTLVCRLLCQIPDVIGLNEPLEASLFPNRAKALKSINRSFKAFRKSLLKRGSAPVRAKDGTITDNAYSELIGPRHKVLKRTEVHFDKPLSKDFLLVMKHCAEFSLLFPELIEQYKCFATVRNPLALLGSWNSVNVPVSRGRVAKSRKILPQFYQDLEAIEALYDKQLFILSWYFEQFDRLPRSCILPYETLTSSNGKSLEQITGKPISFDESLRNRNFSPLYDKQLILQLADRLLKSKGAYWNFYTTSDVEDLLNQYIRD